MPRSGSPLIFLHYEIRNFIPNPGRVEAYLLNCAQFGIAVQFRGDSYPRANLVNSNAVRAVRRRGNLNNGAYYGPRYVNANNAPSNSNWNYGSGLMILTPVKYSAFCLILFALLFQGPRKGIKIPSDWNRLGSV